MGSIAATDNNEDKRSFFEELRVQRWDDHRLYHHSRINQSLHFLSACCFIVTYVMLFFDPTSAVLLGWVVAMCSRQIGHFFFEPKTYDEINDATFEHKEDIKVGYNLHRKRVLHGIWAASPVFLYFFPTMFGMFEAHASWDAYFYNLMILWLVLAIGALIFRTVHLFFISDIKTGLVWATKILTDPFHDFKLYCKAPFYLLRGELIDPMYHVAHGDQDDQDEEPPTPATT
ncbi:MAG: Mpo1-like protein [Pseudomonadota bacterium]